jgi:hypothetical protein
MPIPSSATIIARSALPLPVLRQVLFDGLRLWARSRARYIQEQPRLDGDYIDAYRDTYHVLQTGEETTLVTKQTAEALKEDPAYFLIAALEEAAQDLMQAPNRASLERTLSSCIEIYAKTCKTGPRALEISLTALVQLQEHKRREREKTFFLSTPPLIPNNANAKTLQEIKDALIPIIEHWMIDPPFPFRVPISKEELHKLIVVCESERHQYQGGLRKYEITPQEAKALQNHPAYKIVRRFEENFDTFEISKEVRICKQSLIVCCQVLDELFEIETKERLWKELYQARSTIQEREWRDNLHLFQKPPSKAMPPEPLAQDAGHEGGARVIDMAAFREARSNKKPDGTPPKLPRKR